MTITVIFFIFAPLKRLKMSRASRNRGFMYQIRGSMNCRYCKGDCKKDGFQKNGTQRYKCKHCGKKQQGEYCYTAYDVSINISIKKFVCEGVGIRSIARILNISMQYNLISNFGSNGKLSYISNAYLDKS